MEGGAGVGWGWWRVGLVEGEDGGGWDWWRVGWWRVGLVEGVTSCNMNFYLRPTSNLACLCMLLSIWKVELDWDVRPVGTAPQIWIELVPPKPPREVVSNRYGVITHAHAHLHVVF